MVVQREAAVRSALHAVNERAACNGLPTEGESLEGLSSALDQFRDLAEPWLDRHRDHAHAQQVTRSSSEQARRSRDNAHRRAVWESVGVADDALSSVVLAAGIHPDGDSLPAVILRACAGSGHAAALTLGQLRDSTDLPVFHPIVWVVENSSVLSSALRRFGRACPPVVCTSGWPNSAGILLLRMLADSGAELHYHGDLDGEGIRIASYVMDKTGAHPWRMSTADYLREVGDKPDGPDPGRISPASWDAELAQHLGEHRVAVYEERLTPMLLDDMASGSSYEG
ncbi:TIGR02679 family protein [Saccharopolyspora sp. HNM0983]|uniref:TIGR02679 family protein n=1 Tax=Saccharopolyspora montiporae TaxID=2781240 RepID=A0A929B769_9PSEU|nr:TIGR02679 family protein [Saccharopolyspora sp. HNM0983]MBE9372853.1 TIGR02679 family protein [Saccharopolyspora sp. HNM0983]